MSDACRVRTELAHLNAAVILARPNPRRAESAIGAFHTGGEDDGVTVDGIQVDV
jgi:hypothetical protein